MQPHPHRRGVIASFGFAFRGIALLFTSQANAKIHLVATLFVLAAGFLLEVTLGEWALLVLATTLVWVAEGFNTAVEYIVDLVSPDYHVLAGKAKDVAAGAVLLAAIGAVVIAGIVFVPRIWHLF